MVCKESTECIQYNTIQYNIYIYFFINLYMLCIYRMFFLFNLKYVSTSGGLYSSDVPLYFFIENDLLFL